MNGAGGETLERKRDVMSLSEWRAAHVGMWAWVLQRFSALLILMFVILHFCYPYQVLFQICLLGVATFHAVLGLRVILLDLGTRILLQKVLFWALTAVGVIAFIIVLKWRILY